MKPRLVFVSLLAGLLASQILSVVFKDIWPRYIAPQFVTPGINPDLAWVGYALAALLIFASGYASARLEWSRSWKDAVQTGVGAGLLAGSLAYLLSSASAASGLMGQKEILLSIPRTIANDHEGLKLLIQGVVNTIVWVQVFFWVFLLSSIILGGLGGLFSRLEGPGGWGKAPAPKALFLSRLTVYPLGFFAIFNLAITFAGMGLMPDTIARTVENVGAVDGLLLPVWATFVLPLITAMVFLIVCLILIMQSLFQSWQHSEKRFPMKIALVLSGLVMLPLIVTVSYQLAWLILATLVVIGLVLWFAQRLQPPNIDKEAGETQPYSLLDVLASALTQGIVSSVAGIGSLVAHALTLVLIAVVNIPHLTKSGPLESTAQEQIASLYTTSSVQNISFLIVASIVGLIVAAVGVWIRRLRLAPRPQPLIGTVLSNDE